MPHTSVLMSDIRYNSAILLTRKCVCLGLSTQTLQDVPNDCLLRVFNLSNRGHFALVFAAIKLYN